MLYANGVLLILCVIGLTATAIGVLAGTMAIDVAICLALANLILGWISATNIDDLERDHDR